MAGNSKLKRVFLLTILTCSGLLWGANADKSKNLLNNFNFESPKGVLTDWAAGGNKILTLTGKEAGGGKRSVKFVPPETQKSTLVFYHKQRISVKAGEKMTFSFSAKGKGSVTCGIFWYNASRKRSALTFKAVSLGADWQRFDREFTVPAKAVSVQVFFYIPPAQALAKRYKSYAGFNFCLDDVSLIKGKPVPVYPKTEKKNAIRIYHSPQAPASVRRAASELRKYIAQCYNEEVGISTKPASPMIVLGDTPEARKAGVDFSKIPYEGYRVFRKGADLFIAGRDIPADGVNEFGGFSTGTLFGTYEFLERCLGVRFLLPGKHGDFVPKKKGSFTLPQIKFSGAPRFRARYLSCVGFHPEINNWMIKNKIARHKVQATGSFYCQYNHAWQIYYPTKGSAFDRGIFETAQDLYKRDPEFFAMNVEGKRMPPVDQSKLCMTNPRVIKETAKRVLKYLEKNRSAALSPNDGVNFCKCPPCRKLYRNNGKDITPAVLFFYNSVAKEVGKVSRKPLGGYVYLNYMTPPEKAVRLEPNLYLCLAPADTYGFINYRKGALEKWEKLIGDWGKFSSNMIYYGADTWIREYCGVPLPDCAELLSRMFKHLNRSGFMSIASFYGGAAWGTDGIRNYLISKLMWDPFTDIKKLRQEFFQCAYGAAAPYVAEFYKLSDEALVEAQNTGRRITHNISIHQLKPFAKRWPQMSKLLKKASDSKLTSSERYRLELILNNQKVFHYTLRKFAMIQAKPGDFLYLDDAAFTKLTAEKRFSGKTNDYTKIFCSRKSSVNSTYLKSLLKKLDVSPGKPLAKAAVLPKRSYRFWLYQEILLYAPENQEIVVKMQPDLRPGATPDFPFYTLFSSSGKELLYGLAEKNTIRFKARKGEFYFLTLQPIGEYQLYHVSANVPWGAGDSIDPHGMLLRSQAAPAYFYVPENIGDFELYLEASAPVEFTVRRPDGSIFKRGKQRYAVIKVPAKEARSGYWSFTLPPKIVQAYLRQDKKLSGIFMFEPEQLLKIQRKASK